MGSTGGVLGGGVSPCPTPHPLVLSHGGRRGALAQGQQWPCLPPSLSPPPRVPIPALGLAGGQWGRGREGGWDVWGPAKGRGGKGGPYGCCGSPHRCFSALFWILEGSSKSLHPQSRT